MFNKRNLVAAIAFAIPALVAQDDGGLQELNHRNGIRRLRLISIDGMHVLDYLNCGTGGYCPTLTTLGKTGVKYTRTSTSRHPIHSLG